jgi:hypothetical protein
MRGFVKADGTSAVPEGIVDHAIGAENVVLDLEIQKRLDSILSGELAENEKAQYKLEVAFTEDRSVHRPFSGVISMWTNGGYAHGGGDEVVYFCSAAVEKKGETRMCGSPLDLKWIHKRAAVCPVCRNAVDPKELTGQILAKLTVQNWTKLITKTWLQLGSNADIRIGMLKGDLRRATEDEQSTTRFGGEKLLKVRVEREWTIYPLRNILRDTAAGASLAGHIRAFLSA